jgi:hypothetical protein
MSVIRRAMGASVLAVAGTLATLAVAAPAQAASWNYVATYPTISQCSSVGAQYVHYGLASKYKCTVVYSSTVALYVYN